ncbi:MAG: hypothetical protein DI568_00115 [Sphingomonas sp.]|nr:MAG: hypothetical protein DI568_00115 [Sphingomonas sp.]
MLTLALFANLAMLANAPAQAEPGRNLSCRELPGADLSGADPAFLIMGEAHGTAELPAAFADLVCARARRGGPLTVGLEFLPEDQGALDSYLLSDGSEAAKAQLLASPGWRRLDGRGSQALLDMTERLRQLRAEGVDLRLIAFDHPSERPGTSAARERGMADLLLAARRNRPDAPVLALTGVGHAGKSAWTSFDPPFPAMSQYLPADHTLAITFSVGGGEVWACRRAEGSTEDQCGPRTITARGEIEPRGVRLDQGRKGFDAILSVGGPFSASPPAGDGA